MILSTVGHSLSELRNFIELLEHHGIALLVDVRSKPRSRVAHFDGIPLQEAIELAGIRYRFMGDKLGGMPKDPQVAQLWRQGKLDERIIAHLRSTDEWSDGIAELVSLIKRTDGGVAIMCSEADPNECHRKAVALDAAEALPSLEIRHIAVDRTVPTEVGLQEVLL